ncbi:hypothetical protein L195_g045966, partial [Trifolium pratense]
RLDSHYDLANNFSQQV